MTRARDVADTQDNVGGAVAPFVAGKNKIINGAMNVWQRGTSGFANGGFTADRMLSDNGASVSRSTDAPSGFTYSMNWTSPGATNCVIRQGIELPAVGAQGEFIDGATFTFSIYAKSSVAGKSLTLFVAFADGSFGTVRRLVVNNPVIGTLTTSWARYTHTFTIPAGASISSANCLQVTPYVVTPNSDIWMTGMQVEAGSQATPFTTASGSIGGELALCQRYYWRITNAITGGFFSHSVNGGGTNLYNCYCVLPVTMRTIPSVSSSPGSSFKSSVAYVGEVNMTSTTATINPSVTTTNVCNFYFTPSASLGSAGQAGVLLASTGASTFVEFSAEL